MYGVMAYLVTLRTAEIGIRMALGATGAQVRGLVVRRGLWLTGIGLALGLAGAVAAGRLVSGLLLDVRAADPTVLGSTALGFALVAAAASWIPAARAARLDPVRALRAE
ncbi:MAG TPA: FtsX-like permease family protein [Gemmatimonadales bacterium]|nr:FtsX-like permease family protein [Gemmatimonadales bacterium]